MRRNGLGLSARNESCHVHPIVKLALLRPEVRFFGKFCKKNSLRQRKLATAQVGHRFSTETQLNTWERFTRTQRKSACPTESAH